jgi:hypothetical protein
MIGLVDQGLPAPLIPELQTPRHAPLKLQLARSSPVLGADPPETPECLAAGRPSTMFDPTETAARRTCGVRPNRSLRRVSPSHNVPLSGRLRGIVLLPALPFDRVPLRVQPYHRTTVPPYHRSTVPPFHRSTVPPYHRSTVPPFHRHWGHRNTLDGTVRSRVAAMSDGSAMKNDVLFVFPKRISK